MQSSQLIPIAQQRRKIERRELSFPAFSVNWTAGKEFVKRDQLTKRKRKGDESNFWRKVDKLGSPSTKSSVGTSFPWITDWTFPFGLELNERRTARSAQSADHTRLEGDLLFPVIVAVGNAAAEAYLIIVVVLLDSEVLIRPLIDVAVPLKPWARFQRVA